jgi:hypothetical protein
MIETADLGADYRSQDTSERTLGDFTTTPAILRLVPLAVAVGALGAGISLALLDMIGFFTNLFYYSASACIWCHPTPTRSVPWLS